MAGQGYRPPIRRRMRAARIPAGKAARTARVRRIPVGNAPLRSLCPEVRMDRRKWERQFAGRATLPVAVPDPARAFVAEVVFGVYSHAKPGCRAPRYDGTCTGLYGAYNGRDGPLCRAGAGRTAAIDHNSMRSVHPSALGYVN